MRKSGLPVNIGVCKINRQIFGQIHLVNGHLSVIIPMCKTFKTGLVKIGKINTESICTGLLCYVILICGIIEFGIDSASVAVQMKEVGRIERIIILIGNNFRDRFSLEIDVEIIGPYAGHS